MTGQRQIAYFIAAGVLLGNDMLDVMRNVKAFLRQQTILASAARTATDEVTSGVIHAWRAA
jgi:hypothetical protein